jgi:hypothetical protein
MSERRDLSITQYFADVDDTWVDVRKAVAGWIAS